MAVPDIFIMGALAPLQLSWLLQQSIKKGWLLGGTILHFLAPITRVVQYHNIKISSSLLLFEIRHCHQKFDCCLGRIIVTLATVPRVLQWLSIIASCNIKNIIFVAFLAIQHKKCDHLCCCFLLLQYIV
jgi:hypothetical protein